MHADQRAQPLLIHADQRRRQMALGHQAVGAVEIGGDAFQEFGALDQAFGDLVPLGFVDHHRHMAQRPVAIRRLRLAVLAEEDAGIAQILIAAGEALGDVVFRERQEMVDELAPDRTHETGAVEQLVGDAGQRLIRCQLAGDGLALASWLRWHQSSGCRRRSSVMGNSRCGNSRTGL